MKSNGWAIPKYYIYNFLIDNEASYAILQNMLI